MLPSLFWKLLHQLMRKMEFAGSTGTLKQAPKAILQSCSTFPSVQVTTAAPLDSCGHTLPPLCREGKGGGRPLQQLLTFGLSLWKKKMHFCCLMSQMGTAPNGLAGTGTDAPGSAGLSHSSLVSFSCIWDSQHCSVRRHSLETQKRKALGRWD